MQRGGAIFATPLPMLLEGFNPLRHSSSTLSRLTLT